MQLGTAYLADLLKSFGSPERALVAYNAGPTQARKLLSQEDVRERVLAGYPAKVMRELRRLKAQPRPEAPREGPVQQAKMEASGGPS